MNGAELITAERRRQVEVEGWTPAHDAAHGRDDLIQAAVTYATPAERREAGGTVIGTGDGFRPIPLTWPWAARYWKPTPDDRVRELVKAGALIAAEIDRLQALVLEEGGSDAG